MWPRCLAEMTAATPRRSIAGHGGKGAKTAAVSFKGVATMLLGAFFLAAGVNHFIHLGTYVRIVPPWLPAHVLLVQLSGLAEMAGGIGVLWPRTRRMAGIGLIALLVAVFPANVQMALHPELYRDLGTTLVFVLRLPVQLLLGAWVWWTCLR